MKKIEDILTEEEKKVLVEKEWYDNLDFLDVFGQLDDDDDMSAPIKTSALEDALGGEAPLKGRYGGPIASIPYREEAWRVSRDMSPKEYSMGDRGLEAQKAQTIRDIQTLSGAGRDEEGRLFPGEESAEDGNKRIRIKDEYPASLLNKEGGSINPKQLQKYLEDQIFIDKPRKSLDPYAGLKIAAGAEDIALAQKDQVAYDAYKVAEEDAKGKINQIKNNKKLKPEQKDIMIRAVEAERTERAEEIYKDKLKDLVAKGAFERIYDKGKEFSEDVLEKEEGAPEAYERAKELVDFEMQYAPDPGGVVKPRDYMDRRTVIGAPGKKYRKYYDPNRKELDYYTPGSISRPQDRPEREQGPVKNKERGVKLNLAPLLPYPLQETNDQKNKIDSIIADETKRFLAEQEGLNPLIRTMVQEREREALEAEREAKRQAREIREKELEELNPLIRTMVQKQEEDERRRESSKKIINPASTAPDYVPDFLAGMLSGREPKQRSQPGGFGYTQETGVYGAGEAVPEYEPGQGVEQQLAKTALPQPTGEYYEAGDPRAIVIGQPGLEPPMIDPAELAVDIGTGGGKAFLSAAATGIAGLLGVKATKELVGELGEEGAKQFVRDSMRKAADSGIKDRKDVAQYIVNDFNDFKLVPKDTTNIGFIRPWDAAPDPSTQIGKGVQLTRKQRQELANIDRKNPGRVKTAAQQATQAAGKVAAKEAGEEAVDETIESITDMAARTSDARKAFGRVDIPFFGTRWKDAIYERGLTGKIYPKGLSRIERKALDTEIKALEKAAKEALQEWVNKNNLDSIIFQEMQKLKEAVESSVPTENPQQNIPAMIDQITRSGVDAYNKAIVSGDITGAAEMVNATLQQVVELKMQEEVPPEPEQAVRDASKQFWDEQRRTPEAQ